MSATKFLKPANCNGGLTIDDTGYIATMSGIQGVMVFTSNRIPKDVDTIWELKRISFSSGSNTLQPGFNTPLYTINPTTLRGSGVGYSTIFKPGYVYGNLYWEYNVDFDMNTGTATGSSIGASISTSTTMNIGDIAGIGVSPANNKLSYFINGVLIDSIDIKSKCGIDIVKTIDSTGLWFGYFQGGGYGVESVVKANFGKDALTYSYPGFTPLDKAIKDLEKMKKMKQY